MGRKIIFLVSLAVIALLPVTLTACQGPTSQANPPAQTASSVQGGTGLNVTVSLSKPGNGTHYVAGEKPVITVTLKDKAGANLTKTDFATLNLYAYGPQETAKTTTAVKLLNATADRTKTPHHLIDLLTNTSVQVEGTALKYTLQAVSNEDPGTYTVAVYAVKKGDPPVNQTWTLTDFQLGTATAEKQIVEKEKCAACHLGSSNGQMYMHHADPGRSPYGSPSIDSLPVGTCKACHNNEGYAAYNSPADGTTKVPDPIVFRAHGVHMGEHLKSPANNDPKTGLFKAYTGVVFPANVVNCVTCHVDDRWKTKPTRLACGSCHDTTWFGDAASMPKGSEAHKGGAQANDNTCAGCHPADTGGSKAVAEAHNAAVDEEHDEVTLSLSAPKNGKFFVAGEKPVVTVVIKDSAGKPVDHMKVDTLFSAANFYAYGPRDSSQPVLTTAAKNGITKAVASINSSIAASGNPTKGWTFDAGDTFKIALNGGSVQVLNAPAGLQTPEQVVAWLQPQLTGATVSVSGGTNVTIRSTVQGEKSRIEIYNSPVTTKMGWKQGPLEIKEGGKVLGKTSGVTVEPYVIVANLSSMPNTLLGTSDPAVKRTADSITYQLDDVAGLKSGTYMAYTYANSAKDKTKNGWARDAFGITTFQVGTETPELKPAGNCTQCHGKEVMHLNEANVHPGMFDPDYCKACHDYQRTGTGDGFARTGGTSTSGWAGYGAKPISARVHNVHFGRYLNHPEEVYAGNPNMAIEIIFPQDVRNCTVCHDAKSSPAWKENPSRVACLACHDSDSARAHARLNTVVNDSADPYSSKNIETCKTCHGAGKEFAADKVHNIASPYKPPYVREPARE